MTQSNPVVVVENYLRLLGKSRVPNRVWEAMADVREIEDELERTIIENDALRDSLEEHHPTIPCTICGG